MARTKKTARVSSKGPGLAKKASSAKANSGKNFRRMRAMRARRYEQHRSVLNELRRVMRHIQAAIPRLPFHRVVREICQRYNLDFRWQPSALGCLQEALEDYAIEFFQDTYVLTALTHRVTVMPRDMHALRLVRYRYDRLLQPVKLADNLMNAILEIPPVMQSRKGKGAEDSAVHSRTTRLNEMRRSKAASTSHTPTVAEPEEDREAEEEAYKRVLFEGTHASNRAALSMLGPSFLVLLGVRGQVQYFQMDQEEIKVLRVLHKEVNDRVMMAMLR